MLRIVRPPGVPQMLSDALRLNRLHRQRRRQQPQNTRASSRHRFGTQIVSSEIVGKRQRQRHTLHRRRGRIKPLQNTLTRDSDSGTAHACVQIARPQQRGDLLNRAVRASVSASCPR